MNNLYHAPLYIQIEDLLEKKILSKKYLPGSKIPSERDLARQYGVNRMTVKKAIDSLKKKGLLYRKQGSGTFVTSVTPDKENVYFNLAFTDKNSNSGISELLTKNGIHFSNEVVGTDLISGNAFFNEKLKLNDESEVFALHRIREIKERPFAIEYNYLPAKLFPDASQVDFKNVSLYDYMDSKKHKPVHFSQFIQVIPALTKEARLLKIKKGDLLYYIIYYGYDEQGNAVEYTESYLISEELNLQFTLGGILGEKETY